ncbi:hypothetical protein OCO53_25640 [Peribacillus frigoritolerans]|uniref:hypothetical protein n=1 Tax=Peribacillus frigoritolerans TaxID=450367 RepID=UPI0021CEB8B1|nr:hypothetical protein [Peribacillus frigoritolerans]MCU6603827.1 hypothetical protein [Peribacillus frigoritolerans]
MSTCPYCGNDVEMTTAGIYYCDFCVMNVSIHDNQYQIRDFIDEEDYKKSTPEIMTYHTFDLLKMLRLLRGERQFYYKYLTTFKKAGNETSEFKEMEKQTGDTYEYVTRKARVVEKILKDRMGYAPHMVTDKLLANFLARIEQDQSKIKSMVNNKKGCQ